MRRKIIFLCIMLCCFIGIADIRVEAKASDAKRREYANIVLFAHFSGENADADAAYFTKKENRDKIIKYYNGNYGRSMKNYLETVSYGKFEVHNIFPQDDGTKITSCKLTVTEKEALEKDVDITVIEQVLKSVPDVKDQILDYDGDGFVDNLTIVMKNSLSGSTSSSGTLVSHKSDYPDPNFRWNGKGIGTYNMLNTERIEDQQSGVIVHEFLHSLGYPDLYRGSLADPAEPCIHPVFIWDIMASATYKLSYPLAYLRMKFTDWLDIETVTESTRLILDTQNKADGNQAYILKSPLNSHEFFVVEYRKAGARYTGGGDNEDSLDAAFTDERSGVIVYRVNTTVEALSNNHGKTGIYVFRPQKGQPGYGTNQNGSYNENLTVMNAALTGKDGRTTIGHVDPNKKLTDGALTFSDGTNSGIVISNVTRRDDGNNSQMTLDVSIPGVEDYDLWKDTGFIDSNTGSSYKNTSMITCYGTQHLLTNTGGKVQLYKYAQDKWSTFGGSISIGKDSISQKIFSHKNELYFAYLSNSKVYIKKCNESGVWSDVTATTDSCSDFDIKDIGGTLYIAYVSDSMKATLGKIENNKFQKLGEYFRDMCGQPKITDLDGKAYVSVRAATGNKIKVFRYDEGSSFIDVSSDSCVGNTYDMVSVDGKIYLSLGDPGYGNNDGMKMASYDGKAWKIGKASGISSFEPKLSVTYGNIYILISSASGEGNTKVYHYDAETDSYTQEGTDVDAAAQRLSLTSSTNKLFISYVRNLDNKIVVKTKKTAKELPEHVHNFTEWKTISETCTGGQQERICPSCGYKETRNFTQNKHSFTEWKTTHSTCTDGRQERACRICGLKETKNFTQNKHNYVTQTVKATTFKNGYIRKVCSGCKKESGRTVIAYPKAISLSAVNYVYNGKVRTPDVSVKDSAGRTVAKSNYSIYYPGGRKAVGKYTIRVVFRGNYSGTSEKTFSIQPKGTKFSKLSPGRKKLTVKWKKQKTQTTGYEVQYSLKKNFKSGVKKKIIKNKKTSVKLTKLKAKKKYYVRIRTYKTVRINGRSVKMYSSWSKIKSAKIK